MKRAIVILTLLLIATSAYAGKLVFNFDDAKQFSGNWFIKDPNRWPQDPENVDWSVENGELVAISKQVCSGLSATSFLDDSHHDWRNYEMSLKFKLVQTLVPDCRIYSNVLFGSNIYINHKGTCIQAIFLSLETGGGAPGVPWDRVVLGKSELIWNGQPSLKAPLEEGRWYTLRMVAKDGNHQIFIDDELIVATRSINPDFAQGFICFGIKNAEMHFDDFTLEGEDIPELEDLKPLSQESITNFGFKPMIPESTTPGNLSAVPPGAGLAATWGQVKSH